MKQQIFEIKGKKDILHRPPYFLTADQAIAVVIAVGVGTFTAIANTSVFTEAARRAMADRGIAGLRMEVLAWGTAGGPLLPQERQAIEDAIKRDAVMDISVDTQTIADDMNVHVFFPSEDDEYTPLPLPDGKEYDLQLSLPVVPAAPLIVALTAATTVDVTLRTTLYFLRG